MDKAKVVIACDGISYAPNAGAIMRNASLFGVGLIIYSPLTKERYDKITENNELKIRVGKNYREPVKNFDFNTKTDLLYTGDFIKNVKHFAQRHIVESQFNVPMTEIIKQAKENNFFICCIEDYAEREITNIKNDAGDKPILLIVGNENLGVSSIIKNVEFYKISTYNENNETSLNVAMATLLTLYAIKS